MGLTSNTPTNALVIESSKIKKQTQQEHQKQIKEHIPFSVLAGKRETSDIYATLDFFPKRKPREI